MIKGEVKEQHELLRELVPEWIYEESASSGDLIWYGKPFAYNLYFFCAKPEVPFEGWLKENNCTRTFIRLAPNDRASYCFSCR